MKTFWINHIGQSMSPLIRSGDQILIEPIDVRNCAIGDIVLFYDVEGKELILHRLLNNQFITKGDFSLISEEMKKETFVGRALAYKRNGVYKTFPQARSLYSVLYLFFSKGRMRGSFIRKISLIGLKGLTIFFEKMNEKSMKDHIEMPQAIDPL